MHSDPIVWVIRASGSRTTLRDKRRLAPAGGPRGATGVRTASRRRPLQAARCPLIPWLDGPRTDAA